MSRLIAAAAMMACAGIAAADTIDLTFVDNGQGRNVRVNVNGNSSLTFAGQIIQDADNGTGLGAQYNGRRVVTYCADLEQQVNPGTSTFDIVDLSTIPSPSAIHPAGMGAIRAAAIESLYDYARFGLGFDIASSTLNNDFAAAFQLVIWEIVYDYDGTAGSVDITSGIFSATTPGGAPLTAGVNNFVNDLLANGLTFNPAATNLYGLYNANKQDQIIVVIIPTPTAAGLGLLGLAGLAARRRR